MVGLHLVIILALSVGKAAVFAADDCAPESFSYKCSTASVEQRADDLISRLSETELIQQTWAPYSGASAQLLQKIGANGVGQVAWHLARAPQGNRTIAAFVEARNELQAKIMAASAHGIPASWSGECLHSAVAGGTVFPELVTQGATWDKQLIEEIGNAIASEATACGIDTAFSPVLNMWVDSRFGRLQEGYSENPTLTAAYAGAMVKGLQGSQPKGQWAYFNTSKMVALGKHYAAYGAALGGLNGAPAELSERTLREWYLAPWRAFAEAGGKAVMTSHNTVLNQPMHANNYVTNQILRKEFGFRDGFIISDCNDIPALVDFRVAANISHAAGKGIRGGVDLDLQCGTNSAYTALADAIREGSTTLEKVREAARRVLLGKFALGLFDRPFVDAGKAQISINTHAHQQLALRAAEQGVVLLKNEDQFLPLSTSYKSIAVIGPNGGCSTGSGAMCPGRVSLLGSYTQYDGSVEVLTVEEALTSILRGKASVTWALGASTQTQTPHIAATSREEALQLAAKSDAVVAVLGDDLRTSSEWGDRDSLDLPGDQMALLSSLVRTGKPIVLVLVAGRTATFGPGNTLLSNITAIFSAFRPGQMGGMAIANLLTGKANPSGKLAQNWVRAAGQAMSGASPWLQWRVGKWVANKRSVSDPDGRVYDPYNDGPATPLFYFGQGLSYTNFQMSDLQVATASGSGSIFIVSVTVHNTGKMEGAEVVQVYGIDPVMDYVRPWKRLLAFTRVTLAAGASQIVHVDVTAAELAFQDDSSAAGIWRVVPGEYQIRVGSSSVQDTLTTTVLVHATEQVTII